MQGLVLGLGNEYKKPFRFFILNIGEEKCVNFLKQKWHSCLAVVVTVVVVPVQAAVRHRFALQNHLAVAVVGQLRLFLQLAAQCSNAFLSEPQVLAKQLDATKRRFGVVLSFLQQIESWQYEYPPVWRTKHPPVSP